MFASINVQLLKKKPLFATSFVLGVSLASVGAFAAPKAKIEKAKSEKRVTLVFDPSASTVKWFGKKVTGQHEGTIQLTKGELVMLGSELKGGEFIFDMKSIKDTDLTDPENNAKLVKHLKSEDFFEVEKFPTAVLKVKSAKSVEGFTGPTYEVTADLTLKGKTNEVTFPAMIKSENSKSVATANITIDRTQWNVRYGSGKFFKGLGDKAIHDEFVVDVVLATK